MAGPATVVDYSSDQAAIERAKAVLDGLDIEVWQGSRIVTRLQATDSNQ